MKLTVRGPFGRTPGPDDPPAPPTPPTAPGLRQSRLRFLDSLSGRIYFTVKVVLDLPVLGHRSLDQDLRIPIQEGSLDYRAPTLRCGILKRSWLKSRKNLPKRKSSKA